MGLKYRPGNTVNSIAVTLRADSWGPDFPWSSIQWLGNCWITMRTPENNAILYVSYASMKKLSKGIEQETPNWAEWLGGQQTETDTGCSSFLHISNVTPRVSLSLGRHNKQATDPVSSAADPPTHLRAGRPGPRCRPGVGEGRFPTSPHETTERGLCGLFFQDHWSHVGAPPQDLIPLQRAPPPNLAIWGLGFKMWILGHTLILQHRVSSIGNVCL